MYINRYIRALEQLRNEQPPNWKELVQNAKQNILRYRREMKLGDTEQDTVNALCRCLTEGVNLDKYLFAAGFLINRHRELHEEHLILELRALKIVEQLKKLDKVVWTSRNVEEVRRYYLGWQAKITADIDKIFKELDALDTEFNRRVKAQDKKHSGGMIH